MRIAKSHLIDPERNGLYAVTAIALSYFVFAYSARFGQISILAYYGVWLPLIAVNYRRVLGNYGLYLPIFAFSILTILSIFWSAAPPSDSQGLVAIFLAYRLCVDCHACGGHKVLSEGIHDRHRNRAGLFTAVRLLFPGSPGRIVQLCGCFLVKEPVGFLCLPRRVFFVRCDHYPERTQHMDAAARWAGFAIGLLSVCIRIGHIGHYRHGGGRCVPGLESGYSSVAAPSYCAGSGWRRAWRAWRGCVRLCWWRRFDPGSVRKGFDLTGRTYLWQQGIAAALANPIFGVGYQAYWVQGFSEAERLWDEFYIPTRAGFHFHNTFIETAVETGIIGLVLLVAMLVVALIGNLKRLLVNARDPEAGVLFGLAMLLVERAFVEIDIIFAYQIGSFLLYFMLGKLVQRRAIPVTRSSVVRYYGDGTSSARNI